MQCESFELQLLDYLENRLSATERVRVEKHLTDCAECRALAQQLEQLDATLTRTVKAPVLSATFNARLQQRIQATHVMSPAEIARRKREIQAEYEAGLARIRPFPLPPRKLLEGLGYAAALALVGLLAWRFLPQLTEVLARSGLNMPGQKYLPLVIMSAFFAVLGLMAAFPRQVVRLREAVFAR